MRKFVTTVCAAAITAATFGMTAAPVVAAPLTKLQLTTSEAAVSVQDVQYRRDRRHHRRGGFYHRDGRYYYNGHRGYRHPRRGYRRYRGFWFPPEAFAAAIIGGVISNAVRNNDRPGWNRHVRWCHDHYRSYRRSDNTYQPYNGPRRACRSPYWR